MRRLLILVGIAASAGLGAGELACRYGLGLGDPPLLVRDPQIEYLNKPSSCYRRFGRQVCYNRWSMRSDEIAATKADPAELRVFVIGDSVVHGGSLTDQPRVATSLLQQDLRRDGIRAAVMNASAGSWGPGNQLAYVRRFGWFEADHVIVIASTHDIMDVPLFPVDLGPDMPTLAPTLALEEAIGRYLPHYLLLLPSAGAEAGTLPRLPFEEEARRQGAWALRELLVEARAHARTVAVIHHREQGEPPTSPHAELLARTVTAAGVPLIDDGAILAAVPAAYRDQIHLSDAGQAAYARLYRCVVEAGRAALQASRRCTAGG